MSSIGASGLSLGGYLQGSTAGSASQQAAASDASSDSQQVQGGRHHHHHGGGGGGGGGESFSKIEQAVTSALQSAQGNSSADPNTIIKNAITQVLQNPSTSTPSGSTAAAQNGAATEQAAGGQNFTSMLQQLGVNPQQFHADFVSAIQAAQGGQVDPSTALQSFPPGSTIDTTA